MAEKNLPPTERKLRKAREQGQVARSAQAAGTAVLLVALGMSGYAVPALWRNLAALAHACLTPAGDDAAIADLLSRIAMTVAALLIVPMLAGVLCNLVITGPLLAPRVLLPKLERLNPVQNLKSRIFGKRAWMNLLRAGVSAVGVGAICAAILSQQLATLPRTVFAEPETLAAVAGMLVRRLCWSAAVLYVALAMIDVLYQRWQHVKDLRMSHDEYKREYRDSEGDPFLKAARRQMYAEMSQKAALARVQREADVLVRNPTHLACALRYDPDAGGAPPVMIAKGAGWMAQEMLDVARRRGVPTVRDVALARALYRLESDTPIPPELYDATVAVLRWVIEQCEAEGRPPPWEQRRRRRDATP